MANQAPTKDQLYKMRAFSKLDQHITRKQNQRKLSTYQHLHLHYLNPIFERVRREQANQTSADNSTGV